MTATALAVRCLANELRDGLLKLDIDRLIEVSAVLIQIAQSGNEADRVGMRKFMTLGSVSKAPMTQATSGHSQGTIQAVL